MTDPLSPHFVAAAPSDPAISEPVLHPELPIKPWMDARLARLPGIVPMEPGVWLAADAAFADQMRLRARLLAERPAAVHALLPEGEAAARELLALVLDALPGQGYRLGPDRALRPDGVEVLLDFEAPLVTLGHLVQDDLCLLAAGPEGSHRLIGAVLCFPASWTLAEKIGRDLLRIHRPVAGYAGDLARRVQRLHDAVRPGQMLMRANALDYRDPSLHHPRREADPHIPPDPRDPAPGRFIRVERQVLTRLPQSGAVLFAIRTHVVARTVLTPEEDAAFVAWKLAGLGAE